MFTVNIIDAWTHVFLYIFSQMAMEPPSYVGLI